MKTLSGIYIIVFSLFATAAVAAEPPSRPSNPAKVGIISKVIADAVTVRPMPSRADTQPAERTFQVNPQNCEIRVTNAMRRENSVSSGALGDLRVGQRVAIRLSGQIATSITILPDLPIRCVLVSVDGGQLQVRIPSTPGVEEKRNYSLTADVRVLRQIFGFAPEPSQLEALRPGSEVNLTSQGSKLLEVVVLEPLVSGKVLRVDPQAIVLETARKRGTLSGLQFTYTISPSQTAIYLPELVDIVRSQGGPKAYLVKYSKKGTFADIKVGQQVTIAPDLLVARAIRVMPDGSTTRPGNRAP